MGVRRRLLRGVGTLGLLARCACASGCGGTTDGDAADAGAESGLQPDAGSADSLPTTLVTGAPCDLDIECGPAGACLGDRSLISPTGQPVAVPGGYCTKLACRKGQGETECGVRGYCFDLGPFICEPLGVCLQTCSTDSDCRAGYACGAGGSDGSAALPFPACVPPGLLGGAC